MLLQSGVKAKTNFDECLFRSAFAASPRFLFWFLVRLSQSWANLSIKNVAMKAPEVAEEVAENKQFISMNLEHFDLHLYLTGKNPTFLALPLKRSCLFSGRSVP